MSRGYASEKFSQAIDILATSPETIQQRVGDAYISALIHIDAKDLPENLRAEFKALCERLTREPAQGNEGTVMATIQTVTTNEAVEIAKRILYMANVTEDSLDSASQG